MDLSHYKKKFDKTITLEFYINGYKELIVKFNNKKYTISSFFSKEEDALKISYIVCNEFQVQFPDKFQKVYKESRNWIETFIKFINNYLFVYDNYLDILIRKNGDVIIHLER